MKSGATCLLKIELNADISLVDDIIFTLKGNKTIQKVYPLEVLFKDDSFYIPLTQQDTAELSSWHNCKVEVEAQIDFKNKSVAKSKIFSFDISSTLATKFIEGNTPNNPDTSDIGLVIDGTFVAENDGSLINKAEVIQLINNRMPKAISDWLAAHTGVITDENVDAVVSEKVKASENVIRKSVEELDNNFNERAQTVFDDYSKVKKVVFEDGFKELFDTQMQADETRVKKEELDSRVNELLDVDNVIYNKDFTITFTDNLTTNKKPGSRVSEKLVFSDSEKNKHMHFSFVSRQDVNVCALYDSNNTLLHSFTDGIYGTMYTGDIDLSLYPTVSYAIFVGYNTSSGSEVVQGRNYFYSKNYKHIDTVINENTTKLNTLENNLSDTNKFVKSKTIVLSNNDKFNSFFKEIHIPKEHYNYITGFKVEKGKQITLNGETVYRVLVRVYDTSSLSYVNFDRKIFDTQEEAINYCTEEYCSTTEGQAFRAYALVDWSVIPDGGGMSYTNIEFDHVDFSDFINAPRLYAKIMTEVSDEIAYDETYTNNVYDEVALEDVDGENKIFTTSNPFNSDNDLYVYKNGLKQFNGHDYTANYKANCVVFNNPPSSNDVIGFHYSNKNMSKTISHPLDDCVADNGALANDINKLFNLQVHNAGYQENQWVETVADPTDENVNVLATVAKACTEKARVQLAGGSNTFNADSLDCNIDLYLPSESLSCLENFTASDINWLTIQEFWFPYQDDSYLKDDPISRATLGICKLKDDNHLYFTLTCEDKYFVNPSDTAPKYVKTGSLDDRITKLFPIPFDKWIKLHTYIKTGSAKQGRFTLDVTVDDVTTTVFDNAIGTSPQVCIGLDYPNAKEHVISSSTCLIKMYTSNTVLNYVVENSENGEMRILWKNLQYTTNRIVRE